MRLENIERRDTHRLLQEIPCLSGMSHREMDNEPVRKTHGCQVVGLVQGPVSLPTLTGLISLDRVRSCNQAKLDRCFVQLTRAGPRISHGTMPVKSLLRCRVSSAVCVSGFSGHFPARLPVP